MMNSQTLGAQPSAPHDAALTARLARLNQLEDYLRQDPDNMPLLVDTFEAALRCAEWGRAAVHLRHGQELAPDDSGWTLREGDFWLAQSQYEQARQTLEPLLTQPNLPFEFKDILLHNLTYIDFQQGDYAACVLRLASRLDAHENTGKGIEPVNPALEMLWLRALHRVGELSRAILWTKSMAQAGQLSPRTAGIASLIALDGGELKLAQQWANLALDRATEQDQPIEALVTQSSLALAARDAARAQTLAAAALQLNPRDGRAWSARAFADLLASQLELARTHFANALAAMPGHIGTWHGQGWTQLLLRDLVGAQASFTQALALDRNFAESHGGLAVALAVNKDTQLARDHAELALRLDKTNLSGRYAQAILSGEVQDAEAFQRVVQRLLGDHAAPLGGTLLEAVTQSASKSPRRSKSSP